MPVALRNEGAKSTSVCNASNCLPAGTNSGIPNKKRNADNILVVECPFCNQSVLPVEVSVIGREHNQRVLCKSEFVEFRQDFADILVHQTHHTVIDSNVFSEFIPIP